MTNTIAKKCPACSVPMRIIFERNVEIDFCDPCHAVWLDCGELESLLSLQQDWNPTHAKQQTQGEDQLALTCLTCESHEFGMFSHGELAIRVCHGCRGTFVDSETLDQLVPTDSRATIKATVDSLNSKGFALEAVIELLAFFTPH